MIHEKESTGNWTFDYLGAMSERFKKLLSENAKSKSSPAATILTTTTKSDMPKDETSVPSIDPEVTTEARTGHYSSSAKYISPANDKDHVKDYEPPILASGLSDDSADNNRNFKTSISTSDSVANKQNSSEELLYIDTTLDNEGDTDTQKSNKNRTSKGLSSNQLPIKRTTNKRNPYTSARIQKIIVSRRKSRYDTDHHKFRDAASKCPELKDICDYIFGGTLSHWVCPASVFDALHNIGLCKMIVRFMHAVLFNMQSFSDYFFGFQASKL